MKSSLGKEIGHKKLPVSLHVFSWDIFCHKKNEVWPLMHYELLATSAVHGSTGLPSLSAPSFLAGKFETNNRVSGVGGGDRCSIATMELGRSVDWESVKSDSNTAKFPPVLNHPS